MLQTDSFYKICISQRTTGARKDGSKISDMQRVDQYPTASTFINQMMSSVMETVRENPTLKHKLFQASFQDSLSGEAMVSAAWSGSSCTQNGSDPRRVASLLMYIAKLHFAHFLT